MIALIALLLAPAQLMPTPIPIFHAYIDTFASASKRVEPALLKYNTL